MKRIVILLIAGVTVALITGLIEAYASTGWLRGEWSSDLELVLPGAPSSTSSDIAFTSVPAPAASAVNDITSIPDSTAPLVDDIEDGMEPEEMEDTEGTEEPESIIQPSTPSDIPFTTDGATPLDEEDPMVTDEVVNVTTAVNDVYPVTDRALEDGETEESPVDDRTLEDGKIDDSPVADRTIEDAEEKETAIPGEAEE